jgi:hypothetical protein
MKARQVFFFVAAALIAGAIAGYGSARFVGRRPNQAIITVRELRFIDASDGHQVTLELDAGPKPGLVLKDSKGRLLYDLPPSFKVWPAERP